MSATGLLMRVDNAKVAFSNGDNCRSRFAEDFSLVELFLILGRQRRVIFGVVLAGMIVVTLVTFLVPSVYRSESVILPPRSLFVERLTVPDLYEITSDDLYARAIRNLRSGDLRYRFFKENNLFEKLQGKTTDTDAEYGIFLEQFDELIRVEKSSGKDEGDDFFTVTMDGAEPESLSVWLSDFIDFVDEYTIKNVTDAVLAKKHRRQAQLQAQIEGLRNIAKSRRQDRIIRLEEFAIIAEQLGISGDFEYLYSYRQKRAKSQLVIVLGEENPEYLRGSRALLAEAKALKERKSDDPFIEDLRSLQENLSFLEKLQIVPRSEEVHALRIDQRAMTIEDPVKPNRILIIALGFSVSLFFGFFVGILKEFIDVKHCDV